MRKNKTPVAVAAVGLMAVFATAAPATADDGGRMARSGSCTGSTHWKLKAKHDDGRIETEAEVDSNRNGQRWRWRIVHNRSVSARGTATTRPPSGAFEIHRRLVDLGGRDTITFRVRNPRSGELCRGTVRI